MSVSDFDRSAPLGSITIFRVVTFFENARDAFIRRQDARATEKALSGLSDAQLRDIGLTRGGILEAVSQATART